VTTHWLRRNTGEDNLDGPHGLLAKPSETEADMMDLRDPLKAMLAEALLR
jgi:hypothetical protein